MNTTSMAASCFTLVLLAIFWAPSAAAVIGPDGRTPKPVPSAGWVPPVLAKLNPAICSYKTGQISAADLARMKRQATVAGLQFDEALPVNCWYKFKQAGSAAQTQKALATLTLSKQGQAGTVSVSSTGEPLPFALAEYDQLVTTMQPAGASTASVAAGNKPENAASEMYRSSGGMKVSKPSQSAGVGGSLQVVKTAGAGSNTA